MLDKKIRRQVLVPLTLTFLILITSFLYASYRIRIQDYASGLSHRYERVQSILDSLVAGRTKTMTSVVEFIAEQKRFQSAMLELDRARLLEHGSALFERLFEQQQITHFYFYDVTGQNFLRVYQPENLSDSPHRFTMQRAMAEGHPAAGLELGGNGTFTLRFVYPWRIEDRLIGYIELGQEIDHILNELKVITEIDFVLALDKTFLDRKSWQEGMALLGRKSDWDAHPHKVIIDSTVPLPELVAKSLLASTDLYLEQGSLLKTLGSTYRGRAFPLKDAAQQAVGDFIMLHDISDDVASFRRFIVQIVSFSLLLSAALFVFAYRVLGRVDERLAESQRRLREEFDNQTLITRKMEVEVAERRRAEEELTRLNEHLEHRVMERTSELHSLNLELEAGRRALEDAYRDLQAQQTTILQQDKMACIGQLAAGVAHDINNPIGFVAGNLEVLNEFWGKVSDFVQFQDKLLQQVAPAEVLQQVDDRRRQLKIDYVFGELPAVIDECFEGTERVNRIVLNLRGFSRIDETEARTADIHECLDSTLGIVANELRYKAEIKKNYGSIPQLSCYPQQLNQVFMNLLINAAQAIEHWGEITLTTWADKENIFVVIGDTGTGIASEHMKRLFEPFFTTKAAGVGTGLGLSIVYDIIKNHHGDIFVESEPGKGSRFTIRLPLHGVNPAHD